MNILLRMFFQNLAKSIIFQVLNCNTFSPLQLGIWFKGGAYSARTVTTYDFREEIIVQANYYFQFFFPSKYVSLYSSLLKKTPFNFKFLRRIWCLLERVCTRMKKAHIRNFQGWKIFRRKEKVFHAKTLASKE